MNLNLKQYLQYLSHKPYKFYSSLVLMTLISFTEGLGIMMIIPLLKVLGINNETKVADQITTTVYKFLLDLNIPITLISILSIYFSILTIQALFNYLQSKLNYEIVHDLQTYLRNKLFEKVIDLHWLSFTKAKTSDYIHTITTSVSMVANGTFYFQKLIVNSFLVVLYFIFGFLLSPQLTLTIIVSSLLLVLSTRKINQSYILGEKLSHLSKKLYGFVTEQLNNMKQIKCLSKEYESKNKCSNLLEEINKVSNKTNDIISSTKCLFDICTVGLICAVIYISIQFLHLPVLNILLLLFLFAKTLPKISTIQQSLPRVTNMFAFFNDITTLISKCELESTEIQITQEPIIFKDNIELRNISFSYDKSKTILSNINLTINYGETVVITGPSGIGKSTLVDLISGIISPNEGAILIDKTPLGKEHLQFWHSQISYITQDTYLFNDTILKNLLFVNPNATSEDINDALKLTQLEELISSLPNKLETIIGDRGILLSNGERQRIALARALLHKPKLLILDEATNSLDSENENLILNTLSNLPGNLTKLFITHKPSLIKNADAIYELSKGRLSSLNIKELTLNNY